MLYAEAKAHATIYLVAAQGNKSEQTETDLLEHVRLHLMPRRIGKFLSKNRLVGNDDLKQEFMIGVALNIHKAKMDVGDPIEYLLNRGIWNVRRYMRKQIVSGTVQICKDCGYKSRINQISRGKYQCLKCGGVNVETLETSYHEDDTKLNAIPDNDIPDNDNGLIMREIFKLFEGTLVPGTNVHTLYNMLKDGIRDDINEPNYIAAAAKRMGGCSEQNVMENMKKIRNRLSKLIDEYEQGCQWHDLDKSLDNVGRVMNGKRYQTMQMH